MAIQRFILLLFSLAFVFEQTNGQEWLDGFFQKVKESLDGASEYVAEQYEETVRQAQRELKRAPWVSIKRF